MTEQTGYVPPILTPLSPSDAIDAIADAHESEVGGEIPTNLLVALSAQSALETGRWTSLWNYNFGNVRGKSAEGLWTSFRAGEIINGKEVFLPPGPKNMFAASTSRVKGAKTFVRFICVATVPGRPNRYAGAVAAALAGDLPGYVHALKAAGYFTANEARYLRGEISVSKWLESLPALVPWLRDQNGRCAHNE